MSEISQTSSLSSPSPPLLSQSVRPLLPPPLSPSLPPSLPVSANESFCSLLRETPQTADGCSSTAQQANECTTNIMVKLELAVAAAWSIKLLPFRNDGGI